MSPDDVLRLLVKSREDAGLSQRQWAIQAGFSSQLVNKIESGSRQLTLKNLEPLAAVLGFRVEIELLSQDDAEELSEARAVLDRLGADQLDKALRMLKVLERLDRRGQDLFNASLRHLETATGLDLEKAEELDRDEPGRRQRGA